VSGDGSARQMRDDRRRRASASTARLTVNCTPLLTHEVEGPTSGQTVEFASQFALTAAGGVLPAGFYSLRLNTRPTSVHAEELPQRLYIDYGEGLSHATSILLPPLRSGDCTGHISLSSPARRLHLHVLGGPLPTSMTRLELTRLGPKNPVVATLCRAWHLYRSNPRQLGAKVIRRLARPLQRAVPAPLRIVGSKVRRKLFRVAASSGYRLWREAFVTLDEHDRKRIAEELRSVRFKPLISVIMPTYNSPIALLREAVNSVRKQIYPHWELCVADDASRDPDVRRLLEEFRASDERIKVVYCARNGHISRATNEALQIATGEYVALFDHDDLLSEDALYEVVRELNENPSARLLYSDEDKVDEAGNQFEPYFKPAYSPDLLLSQNYISHLTVYETGLVREVGGMRPGYEGAQDYDLVLRVVERLTSDQIRHIPRVLYHWRATAGSTSTGAGAKPYATKAARRAVGEHLARIGANAEVVEAPGYPHYHRVVWKLPEPPPKVSILIPLRDNVGLLRACINSIRSRTKYPVFELVLVDNDSAQPETLTYLKQLEDSRAARILRFSGEFNYSAINNFGVGKCEGEVVVLLNSDVEVLNLTWLETLASHALRPEVGAVGAKLLYPDGSLQHAGLTLGVGGVASHAFSGSTPNNVGHFAHDALTRNVSAVTGACLATRKALYESVGGLDEHDLTVGYNDVDYCLRLMASGFRVVYDPSVELLHHESKTRGADLGGGKLERFLTEQATMRARWTASLNADPFYSPNLSLASTNHQPAWPPRRRSPC
jgi:GT2 family glycosyltransferase